MLKIKSVSNKITEYTSYSDEYILFSIEFSRRMEGVAVIFHLMNSDNSCIEIGVDGNSGAIMYVTFLSVKKIININHAFDPPGYNSRGTIFLEINYVIASGERMVLIKEDSEYKILVYDNGIYISISEENVDSSFLMANMSFFAINNRITGIFFSLDSFTLLKIRNALAGV